MGRRINDERNPKTGRDPGTGDDGFKPLPTLFSGTLFKTKRVADEIADGQLVQTEANQHGEYSKQRPFACISDTANRASLQFRQLDARKCRGATGLGRGTEKKLNKYNF